jgi:hypothetical protein
LDSRGGVRAAHQRGVAMVWNIKFKDEPFLLINDSDTPDQGAIATIGQYESFSLNYAHLSLDGKVKRFQRVIGNKDDIEVIDIYER